MLLKPLFSSISVEKLRLLIKNGGLDINFSDRKGENVLFNFNLHNYIELSKKESDCLNIFVQNGIDINCINEKGNNLLYSLMGGDSPHDNQYLKFNILSSNYNLDCFLNLINYGIDIHYVNEEKERNSLFLSHFKETEILLNYCVDFYQEDSEGMFPVFYQFKNYLHYIHEWIHYDDGSQELEENMLSLLSLYGNNNFDFNKKNKNNLNFIEFIVENLKVLKNKTSEYPNIPDKIINFLLNLNLKIDDKFLTDSNYKDILLINKIQSLREKEILTNTLKTNYDISNKKKNRL